MYAATPALAYFSFPRLVAIIWKEGLTALTVPVFFCQAELSRMECVVRKGFVEEEFFVLCRRQPAKVSKGMSGAFQGFLLIYLYLQSKSTGAFPKGPRPVGQGAECVSKEFSLDNPCGHELSRQVLPPRICTGRKLEAGAGAWNPTRAS